MRIDDISKSGGLLIDNFAGGGGASTGIQMALGRAVDIAINHDAKALAMHAINHPTTKHYCEDVWTVNPRELVQGRFEFNPELTVNNGDVLYKKVSE